MNRRFFLKTAGSAAAVPLLPVSAVAPVRSVAVNRYQVGFAALYARVNSRASVPLIQKWLRVGPEDARYVMGELQGMGILKAPIAGSASAVKPMYPKGSAPGFLRKAADAGRTALERFDDIFDAEAGSQETPNPSLPEELDEQA